MLQFQYLKRYADVVAEKGVPLHNSFGFVEGTVARICRPILNEKLVYNCHGWVDNGKCPSLTLPNGLIINLEGQWEDRRHECV